MPPFLSITNSPRYRTLWRGEFRYGKGEVSSVMTTLSPVYFIVKAS